MTGRRVTSILLSQTKLAALLSSVALTTWTQNASLPLTQYSARPSIGRYQTLESADLPEDNTSFEDKQTTFYPSQIEDPGLVESKESLCLTFIDTIGIADPFFEDNNHLVVVAKVLSSAVSIAKHKRAVYTKYELNVISAVSNRDTLLGMPQANDRLEAFQLGGSIQFPSGHLKHFLVHDRGLLATGKQYVLFLWHERNQSTSHYEITGAYLIENSHVFSLRDEWPYNLQNGKPLEQFENDLLAASMH